MVYLVNIDCQRLTAPEGGSNMWYDFIAIEDSQVSDSLCLCSFEEDTQAIKIF